MLIEIGQSTRNEAGFFTRLWRRFQDFSAAIDVTETSLLAERVEQVERRLRELDAQEKRQS